MIDSIPIHVCLYTWLLLGRNYTHWQERPLDTEWFGKRLQLKVLQEFFAKEDWRKILYSSSSREFHGCPCHVTLMISIYIFSPCLRKTMDYLSHHPSPTKRYICSNIYYSIGYANKSRQVPKILECFGPAQQSWQDRGSWRTPSLFLSWISQNFGRSLRIPPCDIFHSAEGLRSCLLLMERPKEGKMTHWSVYGIFARARFLDFSLVQHP